MATFLVFPQFCFNHWRKRCYWDKSSRSLLTAGDPARIELMPDKLDLHANGKDVCHVEFRIVDAGGVRVPDSSPEVPFALNGPARILGIGNDDSKNIEDCKANSHRAFEGRGMAILNAATTPGEITLTALSPGLQPATIKLPCTK